MNSVRELAQLLRADGWSRESSSRATLGCPSMASYTKTLSDRKLRCQLWGDMGHRVSRSSLSGCESELPTDFVTVEQMFLAIAQQAAALPVYERKF
jgi:hypothetical protein